MSRYKGDNSGGYGNPPISGQFKKGNKMGGRKTGSRSMDSAMRKVLRGDVNFRENGAPKTAAATDALAKRALQLGLSGTFSANEKMRKVAETHGPQDGSQIKYDLSVLTDEELEWYGRIAAKLEGRPMPPQRDLLRLAPPDD